MSAKVSVRNRCDFEGRTLWLQVAVDETHQVQVFQCCRDFGCIEARRILIDTLVWSRLECSEELTTTAVFHAKVQVILGLERVVESNDKWVVAGGQDFLLGESTLDLVAFDHLLLAQHWSLLVMRTHQLSTKLTLHGI
jgi:hypothetical protein